jgi:hypothetical protein
VPFPLDDLKIQAKKRGEMNFAGLKKKSGFDKKMRKMIIMEGSFFRYLKKWTENGRDVTNELRKAL